LNTREVTRNLRMNQWTEVVKECRSSGQSVAAWCAEHNINPKSYYYWLRRLREAACEALPSLSTGNNSIVPVNYPVHKNETITKSQGSSPDILLHFGSATLELYNNTSATLIENTIRALQNVR
jgi:transposase-like protein